MKLALLTFVTIASLAAAQPIDDLGSTLEKRTSTAELATFDDLKPGPVPSLNIVPVPYDKLNFSNFVSQAPGAAGVAPGVVPHSGSVYITNGPVSRARAGMPSLSVKGTSTTSFDLQSFWYGCIISTETSSTATNCSFTVTGTKANGAKAGPTTFNFVTALSTNAAMLEAKFGSAFSKLTSATINIISGFPTVTTTVFLLDSAKYVAYEK